MPEDIEKMVDDFVDEMDTLDWEPPTETWFIVGQDQDEDEDPSEAELVIEALETVATKEPWYERLSRELGE